MISNNRNINRTTIFFDSAKITETKILNKENLYQYKAGFRTRTGKLRIN